MRKLTLTFMLFVAIAAIGQDRQRFNFPSSKQNTQPTPHPMYMATQSISTRLMTRTTPRASR